MRIFCHFSSRGAEGHEEATGSFVRIPKGNNISAGRKTRKRAAVPGNALYVKIRGLLPNNGRWRHTMRAATCTARRTHTSSRASRDAFRELCPRLLNRGDKCLTHGAYGASILISPHNYAPLFAYCSRPIRLKSRRKSLYTVQIIRLIDNLSLRNRENLITQRVIAFNQLNTLLIIADLRYFLRKKERISAYFVISSTCVGQYSFSEKLYLSFKANTLRVPLTSIHARQSIIPQKIANLTCDVRDYVDASSREDPREAKYVYIYRLKAVNFDKLPPWPDISGSPRESSAYNHFFTPVRILSRDG